MKRGRILAMETERRSLTAALRACAFFESMDDEMLRLIRPAARRVVQPRGTVVFNAGELCRGFYVVESGSVKLYKESADAKEHVIYVVMPGDCFGEAVLFLGTGYPASAMAVQDAELILVRKDEFLQLLRENHEISFRLMAAMATWSHRLVRSIENLTLKDASARFAGYILSRLRPGAADGAIVSLAMPKQVLASHLGMTGETLSRLLARFEAENLILSKGRTVRVMSLQALREVAEFGAG